MKTDLNMSDGSSPISYISFKTIMEFPKSEHLLILVIVLIIICKWWWSFFYSNSSFSVHCLFIHPPFASLHLHWIFFLWMIAYWSVFFATHLLSIKTPISSVNYGSLFLDIALFTILSATWTIVCLKLSHLSAIVNSYQSSSNTENLFSVLTIYHWTIHGIMSFFRFILGSLLNFCNCLIFIAAFITSRLWPVNSLHPYIFSLSEPHFWRVLEPRCNWFGF